MPLILLDLPPPEPGPGGVGPAADALLRWLAERSWPAVSPSEERDDGARPAWRQRVARRIEQSGVPTEDCVLVGDRRAALEGAQAAGAAALGVTWGRAPRAALERAGADWICRTPAEVAARLEAWLARPLPRKQILALRRVPRTRPRRIDPPGPGQRSCWDFPRPPRVVAVPQRLRVEHQGSALADTLRGLQVQETASPPTYYVPAQEVALQRLEPSGPPTLCEWKGYARYWRLPGGERPVAWSYPDPLPGYESLRDHLAFFASRVDACYVGDERALPQPGDYYGGWITRAVSGPFKGSPGTAAW